MRRFGLVIPLVACTHLASACATSPQDPPAKTESAPAPVAPAAEAPAAGVVSTTPVTVEKSAVTAPVAEPTPTPVVAKEPTKPSEPEPQDAASFTARAKSRAKAGDVKGTVEDLRRAAALSGKPMDLALWREALTASRAKGGSKEADLDLIQAEVEVIRAKQFKMPVPSATQSQEAFGAMVEKSIDEEMPKARREDIEAGLHRLGLLPADFDIEKQVAGALKSQAAAYYDPEQKKFFNLFVNMPPAMVESVAAHELVHGLQDQYHGLTQWFAAHDAKQGGVRNDDRTLALRCVVEGEAQYVATIWQMQNMMHMTPQAAAMASKMALPMLAGMDSEQMLSMTKAALQANPEIVSGGSDILKAMDEAAQIEPYVMEALLAAYMSGANFIATVQAGGWDAVDGLYDAPPASSEQCLHPEKFAKKRDLPTPVALPEIPEIAAAGWREADAAVHGELYFRVLLKRNGAPTADAKKAAAGWDGDVYRAFRTEDGRTAVVLATTWDTENDAREFFDGYRAALATKYAKMTPEPGEAAAAGAKDETLRYDCGDPALGTGELRLRGLEVFAVEGFPAELRAKIGEKLVATKVEHVD